MPGIALLATGFISSFFVVGVYPGVPAERSHREVNETAQLGRQPRQIKGWPVPSKKYQRERWALYVKLAEESVGTYRRLIAKLDSTPEVARKDAWEVDSKYMSNEVAPFKGPDDPKYGRYLKEK